VEQALTMTKKKTKNEDGWSKSKAREILVHDLSTGVIPLKSEAGFFPRDIYQIYSKRVEFKDMSQKTFTARLYSLRRSISERKQYAREDAEALTRDRLIHPKPSHTKTGELIWSRTPAAARLKEAVAAGRHLGIHPAEFRLSDDGFQQLSGKKFRDRITQEVKTGKFYRWLQDKKQSSAVDEEEEEVMVAAVDEEQDEDHDLQNP
jgi:hypothetical protein